MTEPLLVIREADLTALHEKIDALSESLERVQVQPKPEWVTIHTYADKIGRSLDTVKRRLPSLDHKIEAGVTLIRNPDLA